MEKANTGKRRFREPISDAPEIPEAVTSHIPIAPKAYKCRDCGVTKPLIAEYWELNSTGMPMGDRLCRNCMSNSSSIATKERQKALEERVLRDLQRAGNQGQLRSPHVAHLCAEVYSQVGGPHIYGQYVVEILDKAMEGMREGKVNPKVPLEIVKFMWQMSKEAGQEQREDERQMPEGKIHSEIVDIMRIASGTTVILDNAEPKYVDDGSKPA